MSFAKSLKYIIIWFILCCNAVSVFGQNSKYQNKNTNNKEPIIWIGQYPSEIRNTNKPSFIETLDHWLFGKESTQLIKPFSIFALNPDSVWVLDQANEAICQYTHRTDNISATIRSKELNYQSLISICSFKTNQLLFSDSQLNKVFILNTKTNALQCFNKSILKQPTGIAYSKKDNEVWIVETAAHRISVFNDDGILIRTIGERGTSEGQFNYPTSIWIDPSDKVYIVDAMNFRIQIMDTKGQVINSFGKAGNASGTFARPKGVATDSYGNIYIVDALFHTIQIFDQNGNFLYNFGSQGQKKGEFWIPSGIYIDKDNYIYIADTYNSRVQLFQLNYEK